MTAVETTGGDVRTRHVVLATGAWTGAVARLLGERVPMLAARGLSMTVARPQLGPQRTLLLGEHHVAVTPIGDELRLSAWFQLNNFDTTPTLERIERLEALARTGCGSTPRWKSASGGPGCVRSPPMECRSSARRRGGAT